MNLFDFQNINIFFLNLYPEIEFLVFIFFPPKENMLEQISFLLYLKNKELYLMAIMNSFEMNYFRK